MLYGYNSFRLKRYWKTRFDISNYEVNIIHGRKQKRIELIKDGLSGKMMKELIALRQNISSYLGDNDYVYKKKWVQKGM